MKSAAAPLLVEASSPRAPGPAAASVHDARHSSAQWVIGCLLLTVKALALLLVAPSKAVLVSLADSAVGLSSQAALAAAERFESRPPSAAAVHRAGLVNLRPLALLACACAAGVACLEVAQFAGASLYAGLSAGEAPPLVLSAMLLILLAGGAAARLAFRLGTTSHSRAHPTAAAAAAAAAAQKSAHPARHLQDSPGLFSPLAWDTNLGAMLAAAALRFWPATAGWWVDPATAIAIALVLAGRWAAIAREQVYAILDGASVHDEHVQHAHTLAAGQLAPAEANAAKPHHCRPACGAAALPQQQDGQVLLQQQEAGALPPPVACAV
ncbi:hypothetical protein ABPG75_001843 [Micractinium tetrahymenae]